MDDIKLAQLAKIIKPFSSAKGNDAVIKGMQKGLGFDISKANAAIKASKPMVSPKVSKAVTSEGTRAGVLKLGELDKAEKVFEKISHRK